VVVNGDYGTFQRYDVSTDAFGLRQMNVPDTPPAVDSTGAHVALIGVLYDSTCTEF